MDEPLHLATDRIQLDRETDAPADGKYLFDAVLQPSTSLSPQGFVWLMFAIGSVSFIAGAAFMAAGAWPVMGFFGLDVLLVYIAFRANYRWARMYETLKLTEESLVVERVSPSGKVQRWRFQPYWLSIDVDRPARHDTELVLSSHGRRLRIGAFLPPDERVEVADALEAALHRLRQPEHLRGAV